MINGTHIIYTVQNGDTLFSLAERFQSTVDQIVRANALYPPFTEQYRILPGQVLVIPKYYLDRTVTLYVIRQSENLTNVANRFNTFVDLLVGMNDTLQNPNTIYIGQQIIVPSVIYEIDRGDSLFAIGEKVGVPYETIIAANQNRPSISPELIYEGTLLIIPQQTSQSIVVFEPKPGGDFADGSVISGLARAFEANVLFQVKDGDDHIVTEESFTTASLAAPAFGPFIASVSFDHNPTTNNGELWVYTRSAKDGSIQDLVTTKITFVEV
ncbi:LysM peptidoglycan-binding domain-containing protein [Alteribacter populi]|uniref:LysM peptidoglycan-binding domain-containing protein n=1 Tax=Alteribacter populi TaxID=2011011 RepID=UPI0018E1DD36|nr:LysM peptidoglycan-binding domain-containing protein [Alteribacter populi]